MTNATTHPLKLSWEEIGLLAQGLSFASRPLRGATEGITAEYGLGPRGAWILRLIEGGQVIYPLDVTNFFLISRSVISEELARLSERRLVVYRKSDHDGRRVELALTKRGAEVALRVRQELQNLIIRRFSGYSREAVLQLCRMLHEFVFSEPQELNVRPDGRARTNGSRALRGSKREIGRQARKVASAEDAA